MKILPSIRRLSSRVHLALGLAALTVGVLLGATYLGLIPDGEAMARHQRAALAESTALLASVLLDEEHPEALSQTLDLVRQRTPALLSVGVRKNGGALLVDLNHHHANWTPGERTQSTDAEIVVPLWQEGMPWGHVEMRFQPLRSLGWTGYLQDPSLKLSAFVFGLCSLLFIAYLRRMLRELDPSKAVPQRVRAAYDTLTEGLVVLDRAGAIVLANKSTAQLLGVDESRLIGRTPIGLRLEPPRRNRPAGGRAAVAGRDAIRRHPTRCPSDAGERSRHTLFAACQLFADSRRPPAGAGAGHQFPGCDRTRAAWCGLAGGQGAGRCGQSGEEPVSGQHEPRDSHADECHPGLHRSAAPQRLARW